MIARISGILITKFPNEIIVDTQGVGYQIHIPLTTFYELPEPGQPVVLNIFTQVREDGINLFGFISAKEKDIFELLIEVNGIGPKLALNVLSGIDAAELAAAIVQGNLKRLVGIPGIGRKIAERIILEIKEKVSKLPLDIVPQTRLPASREEEMKEDIISALINLGYKKNLAEEALNKACQDCQGELAIDLLLKRALKILAG